MLELAATLTSLWSIGIGRALIVGTSSAEEKLANESFALIRNKTSTMELAYVPSLERHRLVPRVALMGLQNVMKNITSNATTIQAWLGEEPSRWKYVYYTEPDLLLHSRPSALGAISSALRDGALMAAHRLEPIPHQRNFPMLPSQARIPDIGIFAAFHELNPEQDSCCDQGKLYPANLLDPTQMARVRLHGECPSLWPHCGFNRKEMDYRNQTIIHNLHHRLLAYPFFTLTNGLADVPLVGANQRVCVPSHEAKTCSSRTKVDDFV